MIVASQTIVDEAGQIWHQESESREYASQNAANVFANASAKALGNPINATIHEIAKARTVIAITHHLSGVVNADTIYVLDQGHLVEQGNHAQLLAHGGLYAQLWQTQTGSTAKRIE